MASDEKNGDRRVNHKTVHGHASLGGPPGRAKRGAETILVGSPGQGVQVPKIPATARPPEGAPATMQGLHDQTPLVEIEVLHQHGPAPHAEQTARTVEVWTQNRVYTMDASMVCIRVADRPGLEPNPEHPFLGHRLVGGQRRRGDSMELSYPYPRPGTEAVFEHTGRRLGHFSRTSTVTRVILRLHMVTVSPSVVAPTWAELTSRSLRAASPGPTKK